MNKPQLAIVARIDRKMLQDADRVRVMRRFLAGRAENEDFAACGDWLKEFESCTAAAPDVIVTHFEEEGATRFSKIVTVGTSKISVVVDVCENLEEFAKKADTKFIIFNLPVFALVRSDSQIKRTKVHVAVRALGAWDNPVCALSLEDAAKTFDLDCDFYEDSPVRVVTDEPSRFYTSALVAPGSAAFLSMCGAQEVDRAQAMVKVLEKASEILVRRWDAAHACIVEGRAKQPEL